MKISGAIYYNGFFPGYIGVVPNSLFTVHVHGMEAILYIVRHLSPVVITDFGNDFLPLDQEGGHFNTLVHPIDQAPTNTIGAAFRAVNGVEPREFFCTKDHNYTLYRKQSFTEITVGAETDDIQDQNSVSPRLFNQAIDEFIQIYRILTHDVWVSRPERLQKNVPIIRTAAAAYIPNQMTATKQGRLAAHLPTRFEPIIYSVQEYAEDTPSLRHDPAHASMQLGHHLAVGTRLSDAQNALLDCFAMLSNSRNYRFALVESFSIAEVISFDYIEKLRRTDQELNLFLKKKEQKSALRMDDLINSLFPTIFAKYIRSFPDFIKNLRLTQQARNATLHRGKIVEVADAERAINAVQHLIFAIELPSWASFPPDLNETP